MQLNVRQPELALETGQVLTLDDAEGLRILARAGTIWVTEEGERKDHIVRPGDTLTVAHDVIECCFPEIPLYRHLQSASRSLLISIIDYVPHPISVRLVGL